VSKCEGCEEHEAARYTIDDVHLCVECYQALIDESKPTWKYNKGDDEVITSYDGMILIVEDERLQMPEHIGHLIAAAPDMLKMLERMQHKGEFGCAQCQCDERDYQTGHDPDCALLELINRAKGKLDKEEVT
jgi:hypothetical protein